MLAAMLLYASASPIVLYASDRGRDTWAGTEGHPFRSLDRVQHELLQMRAIGNLQPVQVNLKGLFVLSKPLEFGSEFGEVTIQGKAVISGGTELTKWHTAHLDGRAVWLADAPDDRLYRQLFVDGERRPRARLPKTGFYRLTGLLNNAENSPWNEGQDVARYTPDVLPVGANVKDIDFVAHHYWIQSRMRIASLDPASKTIRFDRKSIFRLTDDYTGQAAPYRLENVVGGLTEPGEWVCSTSNRRIIYLPKKGERIRGFRATIASLPTLLKVKNARNLVLKDLEFRHCEWTQDTAGDPQAATSVPGAIQLDNTTNCLIKRCQIQNVGTYAVEILGGSDNSIEACDLADLGGGGVKVGHGSLRTRIVDCEIVHGGRIFAPAVGVWIGNSGGNLVSHNLIRDLYYTGISVGWTWGYGPSNAIGNVIEYNDIRDIGQGELSDMGGIYTLGVSPGTVLHHNRIRNVEARGYGGWGIYLDEGSTNILVEDNLVQNTKTGGFHQHYGRENIIRNNVFMNARTAGQLIRTRVEDHKSFTIQGNVVVWKDADLLGSNWDGTNYAIDGNVYWRTDGQPVTFLGKTLDQWRGQDHDGTSVIEDPLLKVSDWGVRFDQGSPAKTLGIRPIDLSTVGPRR